MVWILAVSEIEMARKSVAQDRGEALVAEHSSRHPCGNRGVVLSSAREGQRSKFAAELERRASVMRLQFTRDSIVLSWISHDRHGFEVLRSGSQHRWSTDVDLFNRMLFRNAFIAHGSLERIQIHADEIDRFNAVRLHRSNVRVDIASTEQSAMHLWMQRLHASIEHLGKSRELIDGSNRNTSGGEHACSSTGRNNFHAARDECTNKRNEICLVGNRNQCPTNRNEMTHRGLPLLEVSAHARCA